MPTLYDYRGRPLDLEALRKEQATASLSSVRNPWFESVVGGLTPQKLAAVLNDAATGDPAAYLTLAEEMEERDLHYASVLSTRKLAVEACETNVVAPENVEIREDIMAAVSELATAPQFVGLFSDLLDAIGKGFSVVEILWDRNGSRWFPKSYEWRDQRWFRYDRVTGRELRMLDPTNAVEGLPLPPYKFIEHRPRLKTGIPIRGGLARLVAFAFVSKAFTVKDWLAFCEVYGMPLRIGRYGQSATQAEKDTLALALANLASDAAALLPESMKIEIVEATRSGGGESAFRGLADYIDKQVSKAVLGQTMTTDDGASLSQAQVHNDVRTDILSADALQLSLTINRDLVRPFIDLNFGPQSVYPRLSIEIEKPEDLKLLAESLPPFIDRGLKVDAAEIRTKFGLGEPEDDAEILGAKAAPTAPGAASETTPPPRTGKPPRAPGESAAGQGDEAPRETNRREQNAVGDADEIDKIEEAALAGWQRLMDPVLNPIVELARACRTFSEFQTRLPNVLAEMDANSVVRALALATFKARGLGDATDKVRV